MPALFRASARSLSFAALLLATQAVTAADSAIARGRYLVQIGACADCHAPMRMGEQGPATDLSRGLSGHPQNLVMPPPPKLAEGPWQWTGAASNTAFAGPWGLSYAANLTPDPETGIGRWREQDFVAAMRSGKHAGAGRPILPPMPWPAYSRMTEADLKAVFAYLRSEPAVRNQVPEPQPPPAP